MENQNAHKRSADSVVKFFTQGSHHRNLTVVYIVQNLFNQDKSMRTVSLNAHYIVVFKNPRDATQLRTLAYQMYPENPAPLLDAFKDATTASCGGAATATYGYLVLDLHPTTCDALRMLTNVFDVQPTAYVPDEYIKGACSSPLENSGVNGSITGATKATQKRGSKSPTDAPATNYRAYTIRKTPRKAKRPKNHSQADGKVPKRVQGSARVSQCTRRIYRRRDKNDLQRGAERRAGRHSSYATASSVV
jgi:hypothetical protein